MSSAQRYSSLVDQVESSPRTASFTPAPRSTTNCDGVTDGSGVGSSTSTIAKVVQPANSGTRTASSRIRFMAEC